MKFTKIFSALCLVLMLTLVFCACGNEPPEPDPNPTTKYTITWLDESGNEIKKTEVDSGSIPENTYSVTDTAEWDYTFKGWSATQNGDVLTSIPAATQNATYYAVVSKEKCKYTVTFATNGGTEITTQTVEYGSLATLPTAPTKEGFRFLGWYQDSTLQTAVDFSAPIKSNVTYYAAWNEKIDIGALLNALLSGYSFNPYSYIPETMRPGYSANLISTGENITDYSRFVNVTDIPSHGFGEQWNMVIQNIEQSSVFFNVLSVVETISLSSVTAFNNYLDQNPQNTASYNFKDGIYNISIDFDGSIISYVVDYTATIPALGEQTVQIALAMNVETAEKTARIQIGDANALKYTVRANSYEFAIKYLGVRRAYFSVEKDANENVSGHIYEFLTVGGAEVKSAADFYITASNVTAVGNKADGIVGFSGYISETYNKSNGKLLGYEVMETLSSIKYNTIWLDLDVFDGLETIKHVEASGNNEAKFYINGSSAAWSAMEVGGFGLKRWSRRFDIEFRTQYFYSYNSQTGEYTEIKASVPMLFIQEENYETFEADVNTQNGVTLDIKINTADLAKILSDYDLLIEPFIASKEAVNSEAVVNFIGSKYSHE